MSLAVRTTGSCWMTSKKAAPRSTWWSRGPGRRQGRSGSRRHALADPVAQAVDHQLQHERMAHVERVPGAGVVDVVAWIVRSHAVIGDVVEATQRQHGTAVVALAGVVVDDVEDDLHAGGVEGVDHRLELVHLLPSRAARGVFGVRREEADGVVTPVVPQAALQQKAIMDEVVDRQQLHRRDAEARR